MEKIVLLVVSLSLVSCGDFLEPEKEPVVVPQERSLDGVKMISEAIKNGRDENTMLQSSYTIGPSQRLLLRLENLTELSPDIVLDDEKRAVFEIKSTSEFNPSDDFSFLELCPLTKNWMMLATWNKAHPFPGDGNWGQSGSDFDETGCLEVDYIESEKVFQFDVSDWFRHYYQSRKTNYGWVLKSSIRFGLYGDTHSRYAPRLKWTEVR